jgi:hypothetical protein
MPENRHALSCNAENFQNLPMVLCLLSASTPNELSMPRKIEKSATDAAQPSIDVRLWKRRCCGVFVLACSLKTEMKEAFNLFAANGVLIALLGGASRGRRQYNPGIRRKPTSIRAKNSLRGSLGMHR